MPTHESQEQDEGNQGGGRNWKTFLQQNLKKVGIVAENVVLPSRSLDRATSVPQVIALDVESQQPDIKTQISQKQFPIFMITISFIQAILFYYGRADGWLFLGYDPHRRHELWRFVTIMFVHVSTSHLWENLIVQLILGVLLEIVHHWKRIGTIYTCAVLGGSLAITIFNPNNYGQGASAGAYGLLAAHVATIIINWNEMDHKCCRVFCIFLCIGFDIWRNVNVEIVLKKDTHTSHAGHIGGALTGFLVAVFVLRNFEKHPWERVFQKICAGTIIVLLLLILTVNVSFPSHYYKTEFNFDYVNTYNLYYRNYILKLICESGKDSEVWKSCETNKKCLELVDNFGNGCPKFD